MVDGIAIQDVAWKSAVKQSRARIRSVLGNSLITAACLTYHGLMNEESRNELTQTWITYCEHETCELGDKIREKLRCSSMKSTTSTGVIESSVDNGIFNYAFMYNFFMRYLF